MALDETTEPLYTGNIQTLRSTLYYRNNEDTTDRRDSRPPCLLRMGQVWTYGGGFWSIFLFSLSFHTVYLYEARLFLLIIFVKASHTWVLVGLGGSLKLSLLV